MARKGKAAKQNGLKSRVLKTDLVNWRTFKFIQQDSFKDLSLEAKQKLKASMVENNFTQPFYVWQSPEGELICLDGKHRTLILEELIAEKVKVPLTLPATFIDCKDKKEAAKLVLIYSSTYARITETGLGEYLSMNDLKLEDIQMQVDLPGLSMGEFTVAPIPDELIADPKDKPATLKITFNNAEELERAKPEIDLLLQKFNGAYYSVSCGEI